MTEEEITRVLRDMGQPAFRGKQVFTWLAPGGALLRRNEQPI